MRALQVFRHREQTEARDDRIGRAACEEPAMLRRSRAGRSHRPTRRAPRGSVCAGVRAVTSLSSMTSSASPRNPCASNARVTEPVPPPSSIARCVSSGNSSTIAARVRGWRARSTRSATDCAATGGTTPTSRARGAHPRASMPSRRRRQQRWMRASRAKSGGIVEGVTSSIEAMSAKRCFVEPEAAVSCSRSTASRPAPGARARRAACARVRAARRSRRRARNSRTSAGRRKSGRSRRGRRATIASRRPARGGDGRRRCRSPAGCRTTIAGTCRDRSTLVVLAAPPRAACTVAAPV